MCHAIAILHVPVTTNTKFDLLYSINKNSKIVFLSRLTNHNKSKEIGRGMTRAD